MFGKFGTMGLGTNGLGTNGWATDGCGFSLEGIELHEPVLKFKAKDWAAVGIMGFLFLFAAVPIIIMAILY